MGLGLGSLFNGISTFVGFIIPEPFFKKNRHGTIYPKALGIRGFIPFLRAFVRN